MNDGIPTVKSLSELEQLVAPDRYLRVSSGPDEDAGGTSRDYESGLDLPGLSVNPLAPASWWTRPLEEWLARQLCNYVHLAEDAPDDRHAWVLAGKVVARGPDNEPLVSEFEPIAWIADDVLDAAKAVYEARFDVAEDST
jgi:Family of unknown function (DUF6098)